MNTRLIKNEIEITYTNTKPNPILLYTYMLYKISTYIYIVKIEIEMKMFTVERIFIISYIEKINKDDVSNLYNMVWFSCIHEPLQQK